MQDRLNEMRVFAQVVEAKSFSAAADKLGMSKSLASRHVSALERALSVKLLHRSTRKLSLTEAGALFYEHCARIVQEAELAEQRLTRTQSDPAGLVTSLRKTVKIRSKDRATFQSVSSGSSTPGGAVDPAPPSASCCAMPPLSTSSGER